MPLGLGPWQELGTANFHGLLLSLILVGERSNPAQATVSVGSRGVCKSERKPLLTILPMLLGALG